VKTGGKVTLYSRRGTDLSNRFEYVTAALASLPDETVIDSELVALDEQGKPNFNLVQNFPSSESHHVLRVRCLGEESRRTHRSTAIKTA
jgi:ATP-dependent DNA ligase